MADPEIPQFEEGNQPREAEPDHQLPLQQHQTGESVYGIRNYLPEDV